ncbi:MAG: O-antigen ligase family protein [Chloroflexi bacterium]|nr:O-antigen ligase family protein [Chloroflexota bacterium]
MGSRSSALPGLALTLGLAYVTFEGGAWRGAMSMTTAPRTLWLLAIAFGAWLLWRTARRLAWERTALDPAMPLWLAAFAISTVSNLEKLPRIAYGLWFAALYIALWYSLHDVIRHGVGRLGAVDALLLSAVLPLITALQQVGQPRIDRIAGRLENPNILAAFLVLVTPLAAARFLAPPPRMAHGLYRAALGAFAAALCVAIYFTGSRGAWLGMIAAAAAGAWTASGGRIRASWAIAGATPILIGAALLLAAARSDEVRLSIYRQAIAYFAARPLTGNGLFTAKFYQPLPSRPGFAMLHVHAHNAPLQIAAELGLLGAMALGVTALVTMRAGIIAWRQAHGEERVIRASALAALAGFGAHHMVDFPVMAPAISATLIVVLIIALMPEAPQARRAWQAAQTWLIAALWAALIAIGQLNLATIWEGLRAAVNRGIP